MVDVRLVVLFISLGLLYWSCITVRAMVVWVTHSVVVDVLNDQLLFINGLAGRSIFVDDLFCHSLSHPVGGKRRGALVRFGVKARVYGLAYHVRI